MREPQRQTPNQSSGPSGPNAALAEALALHQAGQWAEAEELYRGILSDQPRHFDCLHLLGLIAYQRGEHSAAVRKIDAALEINPNAAIAHNSRGAALKELGRIEEALASYDRAIALKPNHAEAFSNRGVALQALKRFGEALASCEQAIVLKPDFAEAYYNLGNALSALKRFEEALRNYDQAIALKPDYAEAFSCRGAMLMELKRLSEALASYDRAIALKPDLKYLRGDRLHLKMNLCDWEGFEKDCSQIVVALTDGIAAVSPFHLLATPIGPADQLRCAKRLVAEEFPDSPIRLWRGERYAHNRIRIAYLSADFREHPVSYLIAGLFERHDRSKFEIFGIGYGADDSGETRARLKRSLDHFIDVDGRSDQEVASLLRELEIDIAVDLMGLTGNSRLGIFALRPSPIHVSYLGYAGTTGASYIDYVIADHFLVPVDQQEFFSENVVRLPESFQVNDFGRLIARHTPSRREAGLPGDGFTFCCFNNPVKITPDVFDVWMRLLREVNGSVLWLASAEASTRGNLAREATRRGVSPDRLIFSPKLRRREDHLARHRLADLFLDTLYFNAHTTASDALWAGLPVLTCSGATYASRVAGSLLNAVGLQELITSSLKDYEALALKLARDPVLLESIKQKLARNRETHSLFNTERFARHLEAAYRAMWETSRRGDPPASFAVPALDVNANGIMEQADQLDDSATHRTDPVSQCLMQSSEAPVGVGQAETTLVATLNLQLSNGSTLALRPTLEEMTTYVVLEQETWFEKELAFLPNLLKSGMSAIDVGANVGIYSIAMARLVAPGRVYAYEPGTVQRALLQRSCNLNQTSNLEILPLALSDSEREGRLAFGASSELNMLADSGPGERVMITTFDAEEKLRNWSSPDFVKIDAEGEEERILAGGHGFFTRHSPLVMFEVRAGDEIGGCLQSVFSALGYGLFRLLTGLPVLVPVDRGERVDSDELNIFAAKPDRAAILAQAGLLVERKIDWRRETDARRQHLSLLMAQGFASVLRSGWKSGSELDPDYRDALAAYEVWRNSEELLPRRCAALDHAFRQMCALCERAATFVRLSTLARIAWEAGRRGVCARALRDLIGEMGRRPIVLGEPFWPACPRFDAIPPGGQVGVWFVAAVVEQHERARAFSSYFEDDSSGLDWLCQQPFASVEMERRRVLLAGRTHRKVEASERLRIETPDHLNAEVWRSEMIKGLSHGVDGI